MTVALYLVAVVIAAIGQQYLLSAVLVVPIAFTLVAIWLTRLKIAQLEALGGVHHDEAAP